jgi:hypothetical protein
MSRYQNAGKNPNIKIANRSFENVTTFIYLGTTIIDQNLIHKELKNRLNAGNACYHSVQNLFSSRFLYKNVNRIYKTIILPVVLYGCEPWSLTLRKEHRLRVFENRVLRRIFGPKRDDIIGSWRKLHDEELHNLYSSPNIIIMIKSRKMRWAGHVGRMGRRKMHTWFWWKSWKERGHWEEVDVDGWIILK